METAGGPEAGASSHPSEGQRQQQTGGRQGCREEVGEAEPTMGAPSPQGFPHQRGLKDNG